MGKTALATSIALQVAHSYRRSPDEDASRGAQTRGVVGFFSLEMSTEQLASRILAEQAGVSTHRSSASPRPPATRRSLPCSSMIPPPCTSLS